MDTHATATTAARDAMRDILGKTKGAEYVAAMSAANAVAASGYNAAYEAAVLAIFEKIGK